MCVACSISTDPSQFVQTMVNGAMAISPILGYAILRLHRMFQQAVRTWKAPYMLGILYALVHSVMSAVIVIMGTLALFQAKIMPTGILWITYAIVQCSVIWYMKTRYPWVMQSHVQVIGGIAFGVMGSVALFARVFGQYDATMWVFFDTMINMFYIGIGSMFAWVCIAVAFDAWYWWIEKRGVRVNIED